MKTVRIIGVGLLLLAPIVTEAQPAYKCLDGEGRLVLTQGDPPAGLRCSEEPGLRPAPMSQLPATGDPTRPADDWRWNGAIKACSERARKIDDRFDAYAPQLGQARMLGGVEASYLFKKCMAEAGLPVEMK